MHECMIFQVNAADILNDNQGGREFYAAFAKLEDFTAVSKLWDILQVHTHSQILIYTMSNVRSFMRIYVDSFRASPLRRW